MTRCLLVLSFIVLIVGLACDEERDIVCDCLPPAQGYLAPTTREAVLNNLEVSYRNRHINRCDAVLDENFTFYPFAGDVGGDIPSQWDRQNEIDATSHMFDPNFVDADLSDGIQEPVRKIFFDLKWEDGVQWQEVPQGSESWYSTVVFYNFQFDVGENDHYVSNAGSKAQFTVRNTGTDENPHWVLVEARDLNVDYLAATSEATQQPSWGKFKALYR